MPRFYITTAIDYVNSRPHLGTAYEKVTADVIARYKRLAGFDTRFLMGNDEHSQNVYQRAREQELEPLAFCDRMETAFRDVWQRLDISFDDFIRTTEERHRARRDGARLAPDRVGRRLRGVLRRVVLRLVRGVQAGEGPGRRRLPGAPAPAAVDPREEPFLPLVEVSGAPARALRGAPGGARAGDPPQRDPAAARGRPRGHLHEPDRSVVGHTGPVRSRQRGLRLDGRADQLRLGRRLRRRRRPVRHLVAGRPARDRQGHHPLPLRRLARDADERRRRAAAAGVRARLGPLAGPEDEQVARHGRGSAGGGRAPRTGSVAAVPDQGDRLRSGRRLHLGAVRGSLQRRPREQLRQSRLAHRGDGRPLPAGTAGGAARAARAARRGGVVGRGGLPPGHGSLRAAPGRGCRLPDRGRGQRVHRQRRAVGGGQGSGARRGARPAALRRERGGAAGRRAAGAGDAAVVRRGAGAHRRRRPGGRTASRAGRRRGRRRPARSGA